MNENNKIIPITGDYKDLLASISDTYTWGRTAAFRAVNTQLLQTYWQIGRYIVEFEQKGNVKAEYGKSLLANLSKDLVLLHGKGFSLSNVKRFRQFYLAYQNGATVSHHSRQAQVSHSIGATVSYQLTWSHYVELLKMRMS
ncbi:MAG: DUF1016 N-terminal domain-containing protein [Segetibacter sp.]